MPVGKSINTDFGSNNNKYYTNDIQKICKCAKQKCSGVSVNLKNGNFPHEKI